ncbi:LPD3 domain-containing protein, partial [Avibacterium paragallinarum]
LRIMKIAAKNSAAFARQNKNRKERLERVNALRTRVAEKEKILAQKLKKIDELQYLKAQEEVDQLLEDERLMKGNITPELYAELKSLERLQDRADELDQIYQDRVLELRNELRKRHWIGERYQPLMKEGYTLLEEYHYASSGTSIISVTYRIPELDFQYTDDLSQPVAEIVEKIDGVVNVALKTALENQFQEKKEVTQQDEKLEEQSQASEEDKLGKYFEINGTMGRICFVIGKRVNNAFNKIEWATVKDDASVETYHSKVIEKYSTEDDFVKGASLFSIEVYKEKWKKLTENGFEMISFSQMETLYQNRQKYLNRMDEQPENTRQEEVAITLTGKEFGEFDTSTSEGKAALRKKAFEHIKQLVDNEESVFCSALNANVFFSQKGNRKYKSEGKGELGPIKSQLAFKLKELIASGKQYKESAESYDEKEQRSRLKYHYLKTNAIVGNQELTVKLVIRETPEKTFHYDLQLEKGFDQIFDSVDVEMATMPFLRLSKAGGDCSHSLGQNDLCLDDTAILDRTQENNANNINQVILDDTLQAKAVIALNYIAALDNSILTDSTELAEDQLIMALQVLENNLPINEQEGNVAQAELEREHIASIKEALGILQSQPALDSAESEGRYVLNLFVEYQDENGNWVELKDDEDELEAPTEEPGNDTEPENSQSAPVLLHTSSLYQGEGYRPVLEGRDEEIEQFKQAGYTLEPFSVEGRSCTYSVHKTAEPYNIHITANWYSDGKKSYWVNVSPQKGYVTDAKENNGGQAKVSGANENAKSVTEAIQLAEELIQEEKHYRPLRKE